MACGAPTAVLQLVETAPDHVAQGADGHVDGLARLSVPAHRKHRQGVAALDVFSNLISVPASRTAGCGRLSAITGSSPAQPESCPGVIPVSLWRTGIPSCRPARAWPDGTAPADIKLAVDSPAPHVEYMYI